MSEARRCLCISSVPKVKFSLHGKIVPVSLIEETVAANLHRIRECIARAAESVNRRPEEVTLVAVSKTQPVEAIRAAYVAGVRHFGENRVQECEVKRPLLRDIAATWHMVGHLQSNKVLKSLELFDHLDSVHSLALAQKIEKGTADGRRIPILLEVHMDPAPAKSGIDPGDVSDVADAVLAMPHLDFRGLMCVPPYFAEPDQARASFRRMREIRDALIRRFEMPSVVLSMGMSNDFEVAIEEGATEVRLGTAIFGARPLL
jgi:pyridoxal phosphate enzyme (YggS family)